MSWQKCPECNGSGLMNPFASTTQAYCTVCNGAKIIDERTGKPPHSKSELKRLDCMGVVEKALGKAGLEK